MSTTIAANIDWSHRGFTYCLDTLVILLWERHSRIYFLIEIVLLKFVL